MHVFMQRKVIVISIVSGVLISRVRWHTKNGRSDALCRLDERAVDPMAPLRLREDE